MLDTHDTNDRGATAAAEFMDRIDGVTYRREPPIGCPLCGASRPARVIRTRFGVNTSVAECPPCRLAYQTPRPTEDASKAYMDRRWSAGGAYVSNSPAKLRSARRKLATLSSLLTGRARLLDFGAGSGAFVRVCRDAGMEALGVERSEVAIARAREELDIDLQAALPEGPFDIITLWDVVEHLREPVETLQALRQRLAANGVLVMETGNYENWQRMVDGDRWGMYLFDHHFYFSPHSLAEFARQASFSGLRVMNVNHRAPSWGRTTRHPAWGLRAWRAWREARRRWPEHGDINVMIVVAEH
jgi:2-polyprenyl-3-methyl-5-hydroxy-6-metoxy-1,4-benzoquinol methylase